MPYGIAVKMKSDSCQNLYKIVHIVEGATIEELEHLRQEYSVTTNVPINDVIIVYSD